MTTYNIARIRVKQGQQDEFESSFRQYGGGGPGSRRTSLIRPSDTNYCVIGEWDSYDALADARSQMIANLNRVRPMLEDLGGGLGVTYAVSGDATIEVVASASAIPTTRGEGAMPRACNVVRHRVKAGRIADFEAGVKSTFAAPFASELAWLQKVALVSVGARSYCLVGQWESLAHLVRARPFLDQGLDRQRDLLEDVGGGLAAAGGLSGEVVVDLP